MRRGGVPAACGFTFPAFGFRQRLLRRAHQIFHRRIILRQRQNAGVELHVHLAERAKIVGRLQRRHDARRELAFRAVGQIVHQYQKQAAGIAADIVAGADQRLEALADGAQHVIANLDAVALVERSQRTELKNEQVGDRLRRCGAADAAHHHLAARSVEEAGQAIAVRRLLLLPSQRDVLYPLAVVASDHAMGQHQPQRREVRRTNRFCTRDSGAASR